MLSSSRQSEARVTPFARLRSFARTAAARFTLFYAALFVVSVTILFVTVLLITTEELRHQAERTVHQEITDLMDDYNSGGLNEMGDVIKRRVENAASPQLFYGLFEDSGQRVAGTLASGPNSGWSAVQIAFPSRRTRSIRVHTISVFSVALPKGGHLLVGFDNHRIQEAQDAIVNAFLLASGAMLALAIGGGLIISFRFLKRIEQINRTTEAVVAGNLASRAVVRGTGDEIDRIAVGMNNMLDRIHTLMESMEQVSSDIAHDLRTPLSRLRQRLENAQIQAKTAEDYSKIVDQAIADTNAIIQTFSALLRIAQIEAGASRSDLVSVDLSELCASISSTYSAVIEANGQTLATAIDPNVTIEGDRNLLTQMIANLIENATRHSPNGAQIALRLQVLGPEASLSVTDTGPGIPESDRAKVVRRFYRLERSRTTPGSGLGLALVKAICDFHHARIDFGDNAPGLRVSIIFSRMAAT